MTVSTISPERRASNTLLQEWCADVTGEVLSIGSGGDIDKEGGYYRDYFPKAQRYVTSDILPDMGCDLVLDVRWMPEVRDCRYDVVFVSGVLEHVDDTLAAVSEIWRVLRPDGLLMLGVPFKQPIHRAPQDYYRWTEYGVRVLLQKFSIEDLQPIGDTRFPFGYWVKARKVTA